MEIDSGQKIRSRACMFSLTCRVCQFSRVHTRDSASQNRWWMVMPALDVVSGGGKVEESISGTRTRPPACRLSNVPRDWHVVYRGHVSLFFLAYDACSFHPVLFFLELWNRGRRWPLLVVVSWSNQSRVEWWGRKLGLVLNWQSRGHSIGPMRRRVWCVPQWRLQRINACSLSFLPCDGPEGLTVWIATIFLCLKFVMAKLFGS
jgi:hypothetical protein